MAGAKVRVVNQETNLERRTVSNETGNYTVPSLVPGTYQLGVEMNGFRKALMSNITFEVAQQARVDVSIEVGQLAESVTIGATNTGDNATSKNTTLAGTSRGLEPSVAGAPATENNYQLDGADNREPYFNSYGLAPSVDAVREFKIQVGQYPAEYGAGGGAVINVVTRGAPTSFTERRSSSCATTYSMLATHS